MRAGFGYRPAGRLRPRTATAVAVAGVLVLLVGCASTPSGQEAELQAKILQLAAGNERICRYESPTGSRIRQRICMTVQEARLREMANNVLYRDSRVALHGGRP